MKTQIGTIDLTPTWEGLALVLAQRAADGNAMAMAELNRMARLADAAGKLAAACQSALPQVERYQMTDPNGERCGNPVIEEIKSALALVPTKKQEAA